MKKGPYPRGLFLRRKSSSEFRRESTTSASMFDGAAGRLVLTKYPDTGVVSNLTRPYPRPRFLVGIEFGVQAVECNICGDVVIM